MLTIHGKLPIMYLNILFVVLASANNVKDNKAFRKVHKTKRGGARDNYWTESR